MEWPYTIPEGIDDGRYKFTVFIDSEQNNTAEDPDLDNNLVEWEMCIGDCSEPDLRVWDNGIDSIRSEPIEPIAGHTITFTYFVENAGEGSADPPGPFDEEDGKLVMHLEVMKCPNEDCTGQSWVFVNQSNEVRTPIDGGEVFEADAILGMNWSTTDDDSGFWNVRIIVDGEDVIKETDEGNNDLDWFKVYDGYFELKEQRPDLIVSGIDEGSDKVYQDDPRMINVAVAQSSLGDRMADDVDVFIKITDPDLTVFDWFKIDESKTVGFAPDTTFFEYNWTPSKLGVYEFEAWVDKGDTVMEWDETNNEFEGTKYIEVFEKLPDLQILNIEVSPLNEENYGKVGISSTVTATIANGGVRDMTASEGSKLEVVFYTQAPRIDVLGTITVDQALTVGESVDVSVPITFSETSTYRIVVKVDEDKLIAEENEFNNEDYKNIYAASSMDSYVSNLEVAVDDGLAGKDHPITFDIGLYDIPENGTYRVHFNVSANGFGGYGGKLNLAMENSTGFYPLGTGYQVSGLYGFVDFSSSYDSTTVTLPWIPSSTRTDEYVVLVEVSSAINVNNSNDEANFSISIEKLSTNLRVEAIKVSDSDGSASIKVTIDYPQGEQATLDVMVSLEVWKSSDYEAFLDSGEGSPIEELTVKTVEGLMRGNSDSITFTWAIKNSQGTYVFVANADPDDLIRETDEGDNSRYISESFGDAGPTGSTDEEEEGFLDSLLPAPSMVTAVTLLVIVALTRRRS